MVDKNIKIYSKSRDLTKTYLDKDITDTVSQAKQLLSLTIIVTRQLLRVTDY